VKYYFTLLYWVLVGFHTLQCKNAEKGHLKNTCRVNLKTYIIYFMLCSSVLPHLPNHLGVEVYCCSWSHTVTLTHSVGLLWKMDRPVAETSTCTAHNTHKGQTSMPPVGFVPTIPASERPPQTARPLGSVLCWYKLYFPVFFLLFWFYPTNVQFYFLLFNEILNNRK
jgi:hypothetical protein